jgi:hypothetical protein
LRRSVAGIRVGLAVITCGGVLLACQKPGFHILLGQLYEASGDCIDPTTSIDIVEGPDPGLDCMPTCIVTPIGQNGGPFGVYVSTMCGPYPPLDDTSGSEPACTAALAAFAQGNICAVSDAASASDAAAGPTDASGAEAGETGSQAKDSGAETGDAQKE